MPADLESPFQVDQKVQVRRDRRVGVVEEFWRARVFGTSSHASNARSFKYRVRFPDGKAEYFHTKDLKGL